MKYRPVIKNALAALVLAGLANIAFAQWTLDQSHSTVKFITTKNSAIAETHSFRALSGAINADGTIAVKIDLDSVDTLIPIRNERVREMLFETTDFPQAIINTQLDPAELGKLNSGDVLHTDIPITLSLHGRQKSLTVAVLLVGTSEGGIMAVSSNPILISAEDFGLGNGVKLLQEVAGLKSISTAVPVFFQLSFTPMP
ncbi:MAG: YceI family protein [Halioglobus sp.]